MIKLNWNPAFCYFFGAVVLLASDGYTADANWAQWRGPFGSGRSNESGFPLQWDAAKVLWKSPLKGDGQSSPTIWGNRIFLTTALGNGKERVVFCLDKTDGHLLWEHVAWTGEPEKSHDMNGWASATCATDGEVVIAFFGKGGLHAYTVDGKPLWSKDLGQFDGPWGTAACPLILGDRVIQNGDADSNAFLEAFDLRNGKSLWRTPRPNHRGWSSPILLQQGNATEIVLNGHTGVTAYDPANGKELWFIKNSNGRGEPTVTPGGDRLYVVCGLAGDMYAMQLKGPATTPEVVWSSPRRSGRDLPSPIVSGDYVVVTSMAGFMSCYEASSGKELWKERLNGKFSSSPVAFDGFVLHQSEAGETVVVEVGAAYKEVARNTLGSGGDELFRSSLTPCGGRIYSRSNRFLYCIGK